MEKTYRWKIRSLLIYFRFVLQFGIPALLIDWVVFSIFNHKTINEATLILWIIGIPALLLNFAALLFFFMPFMYGIFGYLKVAPDGIEYQYLPFTKKKFEWKKVEEIRYRIMSVQRPPMLRMEYKTCRLLIRREKPSRRFKLMSILDTTGVFADLENYHGIPISDFRGWDDGSLLMNIESYVPNLSVDNQ